MRPLSWYKKEMIARKMYGITILRFVPFSHVSLLDYSLKLVQKLPPSLEISLCYLSVSVGILYDDAKSVGLCLCIRLWPETREASRGSRANRKNCCPFYLCVISFRLQISGQTFLCTLFHFREFRAFGFGASASSFSDYIRVH